jgi:hypothetical protein
MRLQLGKTHPVTINLSSQDIVALLSLATLGAIVTRLVAG